MGWLAVIQTLMSVHHQNFPLCRHLTKKSAFLDEGQVGCLYVGKCFESASLSSANVPGHLTGTVQSSLEHF